MRSRWLYPGAAAALVAVWLIRPGSYLDDEIGHLIVARDFWEHPLLLLDVWGRPVVTGVFAAAAPFGLAAARGVAVVATLAAVGFTAATVRELGGRAWLAGVFLLAQPWVLNHGHEVITEVPALLLVAAAAWLTVKHKWLAGSVVVGLMPLARHELVVFIPLWIAWLWWKHRNPVGLAAVVPFLLWNAAAWLFGVPSALSVYLQPDAGSFYGSGSWWWFISELVQPEMAGPVIVVLALCGANWWLLPAGLLLTVETVLYATGSFASGGYGIFLLPTAPLLAIAAVQGVERFTLKPVWVAAAVAVLILGVRPLPETPMSEAMRRVDVTGNVRAVNVWAYYHIPIRLTAEQVRSGELWTVPHAGGTTVWDAKYSDRWNLTVEGLEVVDRVGDLVVVAR